MGVDSMEQPAQYLGSLTVFLLLFSCGASDVKLVLNANDPSLSSSVYYRGRSLHFTKVRQIRLPYRIIYMVRSMASGFNIIHPVN